MTEEPALPQSHIYSDAKTKSLVNVPKLRKISTSNTLCCITWRFASAPKATQRRVILAVACPALMALPGSLLKAFLFDLAGWNESKTIRVQLSEAVHEKGTGSRETQRQTDGKGTRGRLISSKRSSRRIF